jgi:ferredoxin
MGVQCQGVRYRVIGCRVSGSTDRLPGLVFPIHPTQFPHLTLLYPYVIVQSGSNQSADQRGPMTITITFLPQGTKAQVPIGTTILEAAAQAGLDLPAPCGGQGRCGRCQVQLQSGTVDQPENAHLKAEARAEGYVLACQARLLGPATVMLPESLLLEQVVSSLGAADYRALSPVCDWKHDPTLRVAPVTCEPPSLADNTNDLDRLRRELLRRHGIVDVQIGLPLLQVLPQRLRNADWQVTAILEPIGEGARLVDVVPGLSGGPTYGAAVDIGTTTVKLFLVDMDSGEVVDNASAYNAQIARGEDVTRRAGALAATGRQDGQCPAVRGGAAPGGRAGAGPVALRRRQHNHDTALSRGQPTLHPRGTVPADDAARPTRDGR